MFQNKLIPHRNILIILLISIFIPKASNSKIYSLDLHYTTELNGNIQTLKIQKYRVKYNFSDIEKGKILNHYTFNYDKNGNKINEKSNDKQVNQTYEYNNDGKIILNNHYDTDWNLTWKIIYNYSKNYDTIYKIEYTEDGNLFYRHVTINDLKGNILEWKRYNSAGNFEAKITNEYDKNGNLFRHNFDDLSIYDGRGYISQSDEYKFEGKNMVEHKRLDRNGNIDFLDKRIYDLNGNVIDYIRFIKNGMIEYKETKIYDSNNNVVEYYWFNSKLEVKLKNFKKYDIYGNLTEDLSIDINNNTETVYTYQYKYDSNNNWIEKIEFVNGVALYITERIFNYY